MMKRTTILNGWTIYVCNSLKMKEDDKDAVVDYEGNSLEEEEEKEDGPLSLDTTTRRSTTDAKEEMKDTNVDDRRRC